MVMEREVPEVFERCGKLIAEHPAMEIAGKPTYVESPFANQHKTLPVRLRPL
jgi:hypothetical protein